MSKLESEYYESEGVDEGDYEASHKDSDYTRRILDEAAQESQGNPVGYSSRTADRDRKTATMSVAQIFEMNYQAANSAVTVPNDA